MIFLTGLKSSLGRIRAANACAASQVVLRAATQLLQCRYGSSDKFGRTAINGRRLYHGGLQIGAISTTNASETAIDALVDQIKDTTSSRLDSSSGTLLLLLTPSYAKHARDPELPVSVAKRLQGEEFYAEGFESIVAVVDGLPAQTQAPQSVEGLAFILQSKLPSNAVLHSDAIRRNAQRPGSLSFDISMAEQRQQWRLQLPLSQTTFSTGLTSTLVHRVHESDTKVSQESHLESLIWDVSQHGMAAILDLEYPLVQLTPYRTIGQSMGNIIRTLTAHGLSSAAESGAEEPASRGLEDAVAAYFRALRISPEPVSVWALIIPKLAVIGLPQEFKLDDAALNSTWTTITAAAVGAQSNAICTLLQHQARLVKVLSGGGGWGKKAGLLSLDPDLEYSTRELRDDYGWQFDFDQPDEEGARSSVERQIDQALGSSVEEGDGIIFFVAPKSTIAKANKPDDETAQHPTLMFSTCEKSDALSESGSGSEKHTQVVFHKNFFGMLSETGVALQIREQGRVVSKTKLEVPGLTLRTTIQPVTK